MLGRELRVPQRSEGGENYAALASLLKKTLSEIVFSPKRRKLLEHKRYYKVKEYALDWTDPDLFHP